MTDGYSGYNRLRDCTRTSCRAHVRRYLIDAIPKGKEYDHTQPAVQGLVYIDKLFDLEKKIHGKQGVTFDAIKKFRKDKKVPVLEGFWKWFEVQHAVKGSRMYKVLTYIENRRPYLETYLEDGGCSFNTTPAREAVRHLLLAGKTGCSPILQVEQTQVP